MSVAEAAMTHLSLTESRMIPYRMQEMSRMAVLRKQAPGSCRAAGRRAIPRASAASIGHLFTFPADSGRLAKG